MVKFDVFNAIHFEDNQFTVFCKDTSGQIIMLPKLLPTSCKDSEAVKLRELPLDVCLPHDNNRNSTNFTMIFLRSIDEENRYYHNYLKNIIFQETVQCYERGKLLADIRMIYKKFIESLPIKFSNIFTELFCQEILCQEALHLNEKYVNETMNIFRRMKIITETNEAYAIGQKAMEIKLKSKLSEVSMKEYFLNEFKQYYTNQRNHSKDRLDIMKNDYKLWNMLLKVLNYHVYNQLSNIEQSNVSNLATVCFNLQQTIEIWGFIGKWLIDIFKLYDLTILNQIDKVILKDWYILYESMEKDLYIQNDECKEYLEKLDSMLKSLDVYFKHDRLINTQNSLDGPLDLLQNLLKVSNECLDLFNGEHVLNIEEKLQKLDQIQIDWFELFYQSSHFNELMLDNPMNYEKEITIQLQKDLKNMISNRRIQLQGENGIIQLLTKLVRNIDFIQFIQSNTINDENSKNHLTVRLDHPNRITNEFEVYNKKFWQQYQNWTETIKNILDCKWQTDNNELSLKQMSIPDSINEIDSINSSSSSSSSRFSQPTVAFEEWNPIHHHNENKNVLNYLQNIKKWLELMKNRIETIYEMRNKQITYEQITIIQQLNRQMRNDQQNVPMATNSTRQKSFNELTELLYKLATRMMKHLDEKNISICYNHKTILSRLNSFKFYAERWNEYLNKIEDLDATQTFKNVKDYLNVQSGNEKLIGVYNQSIIRYLQSTDGTIRESLLANILNGQPVETINDTESTIELPRHLLDTNLAYLALLKQNEYSQLVPKTETMSMEYDKETAIIEQQWINLCHTTECLEHQLSMKQDELKRLTDILQIKMEVLDEQ
ncbi:unnamed protein product [Schistosoma rodhaini]|nr:unnamed protein product [Schistosoma rodhaini]